MRRVYLLLPGIRSKPADLKNWAVRWATRINQETDAKAEEFRYYAAAITPKGRQNERIRYVINLAVGYWERGYEVIGVAHSNGAIIATEAVRQSPAIWHSLHLIAPACATDCRASGNGLNDAIERGRVGRVFVYTGSRDWVLRWIATLGGILGYGTLGWHGPRHVSIASRSSLETIRTDNAHNTYFLPPEENQIFAHVTQAARR